MRVLTLTLCIALISVALLAGCGMEKAETQAPVPAALSAAPPVGTGDGGQLTPTAATNRGELKPTLPRGPDGNPP